MLIAAIRLRVARFTPFGRELIPPEERGRGPDDQKTANQALRHWRSPALPHRVQREWHAEGELPAMRLRARADRSE